MAHMRTRIALVLSLVAGLVLLPTGAQAAAVPEGWATAGSTLKAVSQGFGHGIGMSQWGAQGRAVAGQSVDQILKFYYPGTTRGTSSGLLRVLITRDIDKNVIVRPAKGLKVVDLGTGTSYTLPTAGKATAWRLSFVSGRTRLAWRKDGVWRGYRPGGKLLTGNGEFRSAPRLLNLYYGGANHPYRGALRLVDGRTINVLSLENYLKGVVPAEVYTTWDPKALQAQAIAARTYAAFERADHLDRIFSVYDSTRSQAYGGYAVEDPTTNAAIAATVGRVVLYAGQPAFTQFSSSNGGTTANGGEPYLVGGQDDSLYDTAYRDRELVIGPVTRAKIEKAYPKIGTLQRARVYERDTDHRVLWVQLDGTNPGTADSVMVKGTELRSLIGLRSTYFSFTS